VSHAAVHALSRVGRLVLALAVGGVVFGIASAVQASIPDANGVIQGCYNNSLAHGSPLGALRVIDTGKVNGNCASVMGAAASLPANSSVSLECTTNGTPAVTTADDYLAAVKVGAVN